MPFEIQNKEIPDIKVIEVKSFNDNRGYFQETYKKSSFYDIGIKLDFVQDNHSFSVKNTLRGLHFQKCPHEQGK